MRLLKAIALLTRPATTLGLPAKRASSPIRAAVAGSSSVRLSNGVVWKPATVLKPVSISPGERTVTPTFGTSSTCSASPSDRT